MIGMLPLGVVWMITASDEELAHYRTFIGPPLPEGWSVICHPNFKRREAGLLEAEQIRNLHGSAHVS